MEKKKITNGPTKKITPFLWFDNDVEEVAKFYTSIFKNSRILSVTKYADVAPPQKERVMTCIFELEGQQFYALNGGDVYDFTPAVSFFVNCDTQEEIDYFWAKLTAGGKEIQCGWLTDKYGVTWQIVPTILGELMNNADPEKAKRVMLAMMKMVKLDIEKLRSA